MSICSLILVGGLSSRMGTPKYSLVLKNHGINQQAGQPLLEHLLLCHHEFQLKLGYTTSNICVSTRDQEQQAEIERILSTFGRPKDAQVHIVRDEHVNTGPTAGLMAAHMYDQATAWLVTGCDYPLLTTSALDQLYASHISRRAAITCFVNDQGFEEPLLAIWTPQALRYMKEVTAIARAENRRLGPSQVIRAFRRSIPIAGVGPSKHDSIVNLVKSMNASWLTNVNTPEEWYDSQSFAQRSSSALQGTEN